VHAVLRGFREVVDAYDPPRATVAESWAALDRRALYTRPGELHQAFNFDFLKADWNPVALRATIDRSLALARTTGAAPTWVLSNHDVVRHASRLLLPPGTDPDTWLLSAGTAPALDPEAVRRRARAAALLLLALPGAAYLYQGEELGLPEVADLPDGVLQDPVRLRSAGVRKGRDGCRVPMPWTTGGPSYGFGAGASWLPQPASFAALSVEAQAEDQDSTLNLYRRALRLRRAVGAAGELAWNEGADPRLLDFTSGPLRCLVNAGTEDVPLDPRPTPTLTSTALPPAAHVLPPDTAIWYVNWPGEHDGQV
jgi:alpha-glucosidase